MPLVKFQPPRHYHDREPLAGRKMHQLFVHTGALHLGQRRRFRPRENGRRPQRSSNQKPVMMSRLLLMTLVQVRSLSRCNGLTWRGNSFRKLCPRLAWKTTSIGYSNSAQCLRVSGWPPGPTFCVSASSTKASRSHIVQCIDWFSLVLRWP